MVLPLWGATPDSLNLNKQLSLIDTELRRGIPRLAFDSKVNRYWISGALCALLVNPVDPSWQHTVAESEYLPSFFTQIGSNYGSWGGPVFLTMAIIGLPPGKQHVISDYQTRARYVLEAYGTNATITVLLKAISNRPRPDGSNNFSFPSGHTSTAFVTAQVIQNLYGPRWGIPAYILALITAISRVQDGKHYPGDVLFAAGLGISAAQAFWFKYKK